MTRPLTLREEKLLEVLRSAVKSGRGEDADPFEVHVDFRRYRKWFLQRLRRKRP
jgi:hypothetical protein